MRPARARHAYPAVRYSDRGASVQQGAAGGCAERPHRRGCPSVDARVRPAAAGRATCGEAVRRKECEECTHGGGALLGSLCALACVCVISTAAIGARVAEVTAVAGTAGVKRRHRGAALAESCPDQRGGVAGTRGTWECKSTGSHRRSVSQEQQQHNLSASNIAGAAHYCHLRRAGAAHTRARVRLARTPDPGAARG